MGRGRAAATHAPRARGCRLCLQSALPHTPDSRRTHGHLDVEARGVDAALRTGRGRVGAGRGAARRRRISPSHTRTHSSPSPTPPPTYLHIQVHQMQRLVVRGLAVVGQVGVHLCGHLCGGHRQAGGVTRGGGRRGRRGSCAGCERAAGRWREQPPCCRVLPLLICSAPQHAQRAGPLARSRPGSRPPPRPPAHPPRHYGQQLRTDVDRQLVRHKRVLAAGGRGWGGVGPWVVHWLRAAEGGGVRV